MKCQACGKTPPQSGSLTQWLGLGDFCKCKILDESNSAAPQNMDAICSLCGLHLHKNTGSLTQWAFRRQTCSCLPVLTRDREDREAPAESFALPIRQPGTKIGRHYLIVDYIGEGGASAVYKVRHQHLDKEFAVKVLLPNRVPNTDMVKRFQQEGRSIARLKHKSIVAIHEFDLDENNQPFLVIVYLEGKTLSDLIKETGGLAPIRAASIFQQIAEALEHAHANSVIHRDLKPNNVIVLAEKKEQDTVKLVDFGIAKLEEEASANDTLTKTGEIFGSPQYMSPEQCKGRPLDARSDIYSFGCLMYETLTGAPAAQAETVFDILMLHLDGLKLNLDDTACGITLKERARLKKGDATLQYNCFNGLKQIIEGCVQIAPERRYPTITALKKELALVRGGNAPQGPKFTGGALAQKYLANRLAASQFESSTTSELKALRIYIACFIVYSIVLSLSFFRYGNFANVTKNQISFHNSFSEAFLGISRTLNRPSESKGHSKVHAAKPGKLTSIAATLGLAKNNYFPVADAPVGAFRAESGDWSLLTYNDNGIYPQYKDFESKDLTKLDEVGCENYLIRNKAIGKDIFETFASLKNLKQLYFCDCPDITNTGLEELLKSKSLKAIHFHDITISPDWLPTLIRMPLIGISFKDSIINAEMVNKIKSAPQLRYINLETDDPQQEKAVHIEEGWLKQVAPDGSQWYCRHMETE